MSRRLNDRVEVDKQTHEEDGGGGRLQVWQPEGPRWARVSPVTPAGSFRLRAMHVETPATHEVYVRDRPLPPNPARFRWRGMQLTQLGAPVHLRDQRLFLYLCQAKEPSPEHVEGES